MAEKNAQYFRDIDQATIQAQVDQEVRAHIERSRGQTWAGICVLASFGVAAFALFLGHVGVAVTICSVTAIGLAGVFITSKVMEKPENQSKE